MSQQTEHFESNTFACTKSFSECDHSNRIKHMLQQYDKIICDKTHKSDQQLQNEINNITPISNVTYSHIQLLNDFHHIKYDHNINDNLNEFELFYKYLFDNKAVLKCDILHCKSAKRYYDRRNRS
eukprot:273013_1